MRILTFMTSTHIGGSERVCALLNKYWASSNDVRIIIGREGPLQGLIPPSVDCTVLNVKRARSAILPLAKAIRRLKPDILFAAKPDACIALTLAWRLSGRRAKLVLRESNHRTAQGLPRSGLFMRILGWCYNQADLVIAPTKAIAEDLQARYSLSESKIVVLYNPLELIAPEGATEDSARQNGFHIIAVGRLVRQKGFDLLLKAIARLTSEQKRGLTLTLLGEGPERPKLQALAASLGLQEIVRMPGAVGDVPSALKQADLFVLSSRWEGFPNALVEAMAAGLPVIAARCLSGPEEIITHDQDGVLCEPDSAEALADAIARCMHDEALRRRLGDAAAQRAKDFDAEKISFSYLKEFKQIVNRIRCIHIITELNPGGAENMLARLIPLLNSGTQEHWVVSLSSNGPLAHALREKGIPVYELGLSNSFTLLPAFYKLCRLLRRKRPDIVQTWLYHADTIGLIAAKLCGIKYVFWNIRRSGPKPADKPWIKRLLRVNRMLAKYVSGILCNSQAGLREHRDHAGFPAAKLFTIPNGFDTDAFSPLSGDALQAKQRLGLPAAKAVIGMAARWEPIKGHKTLFQAAGLLSQVRTDFIIALAGKGMEESNVQLRALHVEYAPETEVCLLGHLSDMRDFYHACEVFTLTSEGEGFPNVIAEAMASGTPCVATDVGDVSEILNNSNLLVPVGDPQRLAQAWQNILEMKPEKRNALCNAGRQHIMESYSLEHITRRYRNFYEESISKFAAE